MRNTGQYIKNSFKEAWMTIKSPVFILFLFLALTLWYMNKLNYSYTSNIPVTLQVKGSFDGMTAREPLQLSCRVRGPGYYLFSYKLFGKGRKVDVEFYRLNVEIRDSIHYLTRSSVETALIDRLNGLELLGINNRDLKIDLVRSSEKKVPVLSSIDIDPWGEYMQLGDIQFIPDSVVIDGDVQMLDTIHAVRTEYRLIRNRDTRSGTVPIVKTKGVQYSISRVRYNVDIAEFTEMTRTERLRFTRRDSASRNDYLLIPETVQLTFHVVSRFYREWERLPVQPYLDLQARDAGAGDVIGENKFKVRLDSLPYWAKLIHIEPQYITVLIDTD